MHVAHSPQMRVFQIPPQTRGSPTPMTRKRWRRSQRESTPAQVCFASQSFDAWEVGGQSIALIGAYSGGPKHANRRPAFNSAPANEPAVSVVSAEYIGTPHSLPRSFVKILYVITSSALYFFRKGVSSRALAYFDNRSLAPSERLKQSRLALLLPLLKTQPDKRRKPG